MLPFRVLRITDLPNTQQVPPCRYLEFKPGRLCGDDDGETTQAQAGGYTLSIGRLPQDVNNILGQVLFETVR